jgi:hypothetical protein
VGLVHLANVVVDMVIGGLLKELPIVVVISPNISQLRFGGGGGWPERLLHYRTFSVYACCNPFLFGLTYYFTLTVLYFKEGINPKLTAA